MISADVKNDYAIIDLHLPSCLIIHEHTFMQLKLNVLKGGGNGGVISFEESFWRIRVISSWTVVVSKLKPSVSSLSTMFLIFLCANDLMSLMTNLTIWAIFPYLSNTRAQVYFRSGQCTFLNGKAAE